MDRSVFSSTDILGENKIFRHNDKFYLIRPQTSAAFELSDNYINGTAQDIGRQIEILLLGGYICNCHTLPEGNIAGLVLNISHACNLTCSYCSVEQGTYGGTKEYMGTEVALKSVDYLVTRTKKDPYVRFFGGEPLLNFELIKRVVEYCDAKYPRINFIFGLTTNGTLLDDEVADFFSRHNFKDIWVSLDGTEEDHNRYRVDHRKRPTWDKVCSAIRRLDKRGITHAISCVLSRDSSLSLEKQEKYLRKKFPNSRIIVNYEYNRVSDPKEMKEFYSYIKSRAESMVGVRYSPIHKVLSSLLKGPSEHVIYCEMGLKYLTVDPSGDLYLCPDSMVLKEDKFHYSRIGNISAGLDFSKVMSEKCGRCWAFNLCGKGCHMRRGMGIEPEEEFCDTQFYFIDKALEYLSQRDLREVYNQFVPELYNKMEFAHEVISNSCRDIKPLFLLPCGNCSS